MAEINLSMPKLTPEDFDDERQRRRIIGYLAALTEQVRYALNNLDEENLSGTLRTYLEGRAGSDELQLVRAQADGTDARLRQAIISVVPEMIRIAVEAIDEFETRGSEVRIDANQVRIDTPEFSVRVPDHTLQLDENGAVMDALTVLQRLSAPNMAQRYTGPSSVTVGPNGTFKSWGALRDALNSRTLDSSLTVTIAANLTEGVTLGGITGTGEITIHGDGHTLTGDLTLRNNGCPALIDNLTLQGTTRVYNSYARFNGCTFTGPGNATGTRALFLSQGARAQVVDCALYSAERLIEALHTSELSARKLSGGYCTHWLYLDGGGARLSDDANDGTRPSGAFGHTTNGYYVYPANPDSLTVDSGSAPTPTPTTVEVTATAATTRTWSTAAGVWRSDRARPMQGVVDRGNGSATTLCGCIWFSLSAPAGKTARTAKLTLTRLDGYGSSDAVTVELYATPLAGATGDPTSGATSYGALGTIGRGQTVEFDVPVAAAEAAAAGKGLMLRSSDTAYYGNHAYSRNYAEFAGAGAAGAPGIRVIYS